MTLEKIDGGLTYPSNPITINQAAKAPEFTATIAGSVFTLTSKADDIADLTASGITIKVIKNGSDLSSTGSPADYTISGKTITLTTAPADNDTYIIKVKVKDAEEESIVVKFKAFTAAAAAGNNYIITGLTAGNSVAAVKNGDAISASPALDETTVPALGKVTLTYGVEANAGTAREGYITVTETDAASAIVSTTILVVLQAAGS